MNEENQISFKKQAFRFMPVLVVVLSVFLVAQTVDVVKGYKYIGGGIYPQNVITVYGEGEVFASPDVATFYWGVSETADTVKDAQDAISKKIEPALKALKDMGIEEKDIKTTDFNAYPNYKYEQIYCITTPCPPGRQVLAGYEVSQTITVKVRDVSKAGNAIDAVTSAGATNVSGLKFTVDDEDALLREARKMAIDDAKAKAKELADDLGMRLVRVVNFYENGNPPIYYGKEAAMGMGGDVQVSRAPTLPVGENTITSNVTITYEIK